MGATLSQLTTQAMQLAANQGVSAYVATWANWAIQEIWEERLWPFRVKELSPATVLAGNYQYSLPADFSHLKELRVLEPGFERKLTRITADRLRAAKPNWNNVNEPGVPLNWIDPIVELATVSADPIKKVDMYPVFDRDYLIGGSYYCTHPEVSSQEKVLVPVRYNNVVIDRILIYIKSSEDEVDVNPWIRKYEQSLRKMILHEMRSFDALPRWRHESEVGLELPPVSNDRYPQ